MKLWTAVLLTILAAALQVVLFPKFELHFLAWVMLVPFLAALEGRGVVASFLLGALFGLLSALGVTYWLYVAVINYFGLDPRYGVAFMVGACLFYEALYTALFAVLWTLTQPLLRGWAGALLAPCYWVTLEILRACWLTENAWGILGYSQYEVLPVIQLADVTGVYGVSFVIVLVNVALYRILRYGVGRLSSPRVSAWSRWEWFGSTAVPLLVVAGVVLYGSFRLGEFAAPEAAGDDVQVAAVQGNIERGFRWKSIYYGKNLGKYLRMSRDPGAQAADLVVWPENALNFYPDLEPRYLYSIQSTMSQPPRTLLTGAPHRVETPEGEVQYFNATYLIDGKGIRDIYRKIHLTPFSERKPSWIRKLFSSPGQAPAAFLPGEEYTVFRLPGGVAFSGPVCFEMVYPELVRQFVAGGAQFLVNVSNDTWFGPTAGPYQHLVYSVFRAVENRRFVVRAANTGVSMFVAPTGEILNRTALGEDAVLSGTVTPLDAVSFYTRFGDLFALACTVVTCLCVAAALVLRFRKRTSTDEPGGTTS